MKKTAPVLAHQSGRHSEEYHRISPRIFYMVPSPERRFKSGAIFVPIFQEVCMKVTKLPSGNYRCRVYVGTDDTGKRLWKSFTGPNRKRVEQDDDNHAEVRALHQQHPAADLHTYPSRSISEGNGTDPEWLQRDRGMTSVLVDFVSHFVSHTHQKSGFL